MESNTNPIPGVQQRGDQRFWALAGTPASSEPQLLHLSLPPFVVSPLSAFPLPTPLSAWLAARCTLLDVPSLPPWGGTLQSEASLPTPCNALGPTHTLCCGPLTLTPGSAVMLQPSLHCPGISCQCLGSFYQCTP